MTAGRVLALDPGTRRVGVAVSDPLGITAQPHGVLDAEDPGLMERDRPPGRRSWAWSASWWACR